MNAYGTFLAAMCVLKCLQNLVESTWLQLQLHKYTVYIPVGEKSSCSPRRDPSIQASKCAGEQSVLVSKPRGKSPEVQNGMPVAHKMDFGPTKKASRTCLPIFYCIFVSFTEWINGIIWSIWECGEPENS